MAAVVEDHPCDVVGRQPHRLGGIRAAPPRAADGEYRQRQPGLAALLVLRDRLVQRPVVREARPQRARIRGDRFDVDVDGVGGDRGRGGGLGGELPPEEEPLPPSDQFLVELGEPVEAELPEFLVDRGRAEDRTLARS
jgi:hypothetical protein